MGHDGDHTRPRSAAIAKKFTCLDLSLAGRGIPAWHENLPTLGPLPRSPSHRHEQNLARGAFKPEQALLYGYLVPQSKDT